MSETQVSQALITEAVIVNGEDTLQADEYRYLQGYAQCTQDFIVCFSADGICRYLSPSCQTQLGYAPDALRNQSFFIIVHPDDRKRVYQAIPGLSEGPETRVTLAFAGK